MRTDPFNHLVVTFQDSATGSLQKLDPGGNLIWTDSFALGAVPTGLAVDPASNRVVMAGRNSGVVDFGTGPLTGSASGDTFVAEFAP